MEHKRKVFNPTLVSEVNLSKKATAALFSNLKTYGELNAAMTNVVEDRLLSPIYEFEDEDKAGMGDNYWWKENSVEYKQLIDINKYGFITYAAQEGMAGEQRWMPYNIWSGGVTHTHLSMIIPRNSFRLMKQTLETAKKGFLVLRSTVDHEQLKRTGEKIDVDFLSWGWDFKKNQVQEFTRVPLYKMPNGELLTHSMFDDMVDALHPAFYKHLVDNYVMCIVIDTWANRQVSESSGLFTQVREVAKKVRFNRIDDDIATYEDYATVNNMIQYLLRR